jgi:hypothetical protein
VNLPDPKNMLIKIPWFLALLPALFITAFSQVTPQETTVPEWEKRLSEISNELDGSESVEELAATLPEAQTFETLNQIAKEKRQTPGAILLGGLLIRQWAAAAPAEAARWVARLPDNHFGKMASREVVILWAEKDLAEAVTWVQRLPASGNKTAALLSLGYEAATRKEAATAVTLAAGALPDPERDRLLSYTVRQWASTDRETALAWVKKTPDATLREEMLGQIAIDWGIQNPSEAAEFAMTELASGRARDNTVINIIRSWAPSAPTQTAAWVEQIPSGSLRNEAIENLIDVWAKDDISGAGAWLSQLPADRSRDVALTVYVSFLAVSSPDEAASWADAIQDDVLRAKAKADLDNR